MLDQIKKAVQDAAGDWQKMAMFHFQVLKHAAELETLNAEAFCRDVGVPATYQADFRKMLNLSRLMKQHGACLSDGQERPRAEPAGT